MRIALVHDWLNQIGGAEDVLETLAAMYPGAPIYTSMYAPDSMPPAYHAWDIRTTWMNRLPGIHRHHQIYLPFYPLAFAGVTLKDYDLVLSNKSGFCHGVRVPPGGTHICYCLAPTRYVWNLADYARRERLPALADALLPPVMALLRRWDYAAAQRVHHFVAISTEIQARVRRYYGRESVVIHPPVETARFHPAPRHDDFFLILSRLIPYKRVDLAVQAFNELGLPLVIAGEGRDRARLQAMAKSNITFLGRVDDARAADLMATCRAFIFPGLEDFGIAPVQAQAAGRPVIAFAGGGALDTVQAGVTGQFFHAATWPSLAEAVRQFDDARFDPAVIREFALRFDVQVFKRKLQAFVQDKAQRQGDQVIAVPPCLRVSI
jgi:glycosyltransferase involved in cell wall biosynthesis